MTPRTQERIQHLEDEQAIRTLAARFADTTTRNDTDGVRALWSPDATWTIGSPCKASCMGTNEIMDLFRSLWSSTDIFVQFVHSGVIEVDCDRATARWIIHEVAEGQGGVSSNTDGLFDDRMVRVDGGGRFTHRAYSYLYLDTGPFCGDAFHLPEQVAAGGAR